MAFSIANFRNIRRRFVSRRDAFRRALSPIPEEPEEEEPAFFSSWELFDESPVVVAAPTAASTERPAIVRPRTLSLSLSLDSSLSICSIDTDWSHILDLPDQPLSSPPRRCLEFLDSDSDIDYDDSDEDDEAYQNSSFDIDSLLSAWSLPTERSPTSIASMDCTPDDDSELPFFSTWTLFDELDRSPEEKRHARYSPHCCAECLTRWVEPTVSDVDSAGFMRPDLDVMARLFDLEDDVTSLSECDDYSYCQALERIEEEEEEEESELPFFATWTCFDERGGLIERTPEDKMLLGFLHKNFAALTTIVQRSLPPVTFDDVIVPELVLFDEDGTPLTRLPDTMATASPCLAVVPYSPLASSLPKERLFIDNADIAAAVRALPDISIPRPLGAAGVALPKRFNLLAKTRSMAHAGYEYAARSPPVVYRVRDESRVATVTTPPSTPVDEATVSPPSVHEVQTASIRAHLNTLTGLLAKLDALLGTPSSPL